MPTGASSLRRIYNLPKVRSGHMLHLVRSMGRAKRHYFVGEVVDRHAVGDAEQKGANLVIMVSLLDGTLAIRGSPFDRRHWPRGWRKRKEQSR